MYTNGYTKTPFNSLVVVTNNARPVGYRVFTADEFARESEHVVLVGNQCFDPVAGAIETLRTVVA